jgi:hypothetical protein
VEPYIDFSLSETGDLSQHARSMGFTRFLELAEFVRKLPYGRTRNPVSIFAVLEQQRGTCSSKHALLAAFALEAGRSDVELMLGIFEMHERNTPGVGTILARHDLVCVPEAHCYLRDHNQRLDFTGVEVGTESPFDCLLTEEIVDPATVLSYKPQMHRAFILEWSRERGLDPALVWRAREECIEELSKLAG